MIKVEYHQLVRPIVFAVSQCCVAVLLSSCIAWPDANFRPRVPEYTKLPFVDQVWDSSKAKAEKNNQVWRGPLTLNDYKDALRTLLAGVMASAEESNSQFWDLGMTTLVGGTAATLGALSSKIALTNTGLAVGAGGQIGKTYYSPQQVRDQHLNTHVKLACISTEIGGLSEFQRDWAMASGATGSEQADTAPMDIAHAVDSVLNNYRRGLLGMAPQVSSRDDMLRFAAEYRDQAVAAKMAASAAAGSANEPNQNPAPDGSTPATAASVPATGASAPQAEASRPIALKSDGTPAKAKTPSETAVMPEQLPHSSDKALSPEDRIRLLQAGKRYAPRFIGLKVRLEACTKGPISQ